MLKRLFCNHDYVYLGIEDKENEIGLFEHKRIAITKLHVLYCPRCKKTIKDSNKSRIDIILAKNRLDKNY